jgi:hypothetical protein
MTDTTLVATSASPETGIIFLLVLVYFILGVIFTAYVAASFKLSGRPITLAEGLSATIFWPLGVLVTLAVGVTQLYRRMA